MIRGLGWGSILIKIFVFFWKYLIKSLIKDKRSNSIGPFIFYNLNINIFQSNTSKHHESGGKKYYLDYQEIWNNNLNLQIR